MPVATALHIDDGIPIDDMIIQYPVLTDLAGQLLEPGQHFLVLA